MAVNVAGSNQNWSQVQIHNRLFDSKA